MDIETKIDLVKKAPTEEIITEQELREIFETHAAPKHYIGFEISGMVHLGSGLCTALKIKDFLKAGIKPTIFLADYHTWINGKLGGNLEQIQQVAEGYFKHAFISLGLEEGKVNYVLASKSYDSDYWANVLRISKDTTMKRMLRCVTIMGRKESETLYSSAVVYPAMQAADIFMLDVQIAHAGMDQRKVHMLANELGHKFGKKFVSVHGHLLPGLQGAQRMDVSKLHTQAKEERVDAEVDMKMSKSIPDSAIFIHDSEDEIKNKIKKAYCPNGEAEGNGIYEIAQYLILRDRKMKVERPAKYGGDVEIIDAAQLRKLYIHEKTLTAIDLKNAVAKELIEMLRPSREYFTKHKEYLEQMKGVQVTR
jgi:tyrosyl-tRNA synthetase